MIEPGAENDAADPGTVGLALLLLDSHAAMLAAGEEIVSMGRAAVQAHGIAPPVPLPVVAAAVDGAAEALAAPALAAASPSTATVAPVVVQDAGQPADASEWPGPAPASIAAARPVRVPAGVPMARETAPPIAPLPVPPVPGASNVAIDYAAYASIIQALPQTPAIPQAANEPVAAAPPPAVWPDVPTGEAPAPPLRSFAPAPAIAGRRAPESTEATPARSGPPGPDAGAVQDGVVNFHGDVFLDGVRVGRWMGEMLAQAATAPPAGMTAFDPRLGPSWPGALQGH